MAERPSICNPINLNKIRVVDKGRRKTPAVAGIPRGFELSYDLMNRLFVSGQDGLLKDPILAPAGRAGLSVRVKE